MTTDSFRPLNPESFTAQKNCERDDLQRLFCTQIAVAWPEEAAEPVYPFVAPVQSEFQNSPDPLRGTVFEPIKANSPVTDLVCYALLPISSHARPAESFLLSDDGQEIEVRDCGDVRWDFGVVSAGWIEFESEDVPEGVELSISETNQPAVVNMGAVHPIKTERPQYVSGTTWRLVLNPEFYEGVRFGWLHVRGGMFPWRLRNLRLVCQARPANYLGSFSCDDPLLEQIWEVGATGVRLNFLKDFFGAILMERSDRHSWTGDAHVSQSVAMPVFGNYDFVRANLARTSGDTNGIEGYSLYWILSLLDYVLCSGDTATLHSNLPLVRAKLVHAMSVVSERRPLVFCGHDDRTGACFEDPEIEANRWLFRFLTLRTVRAVKNSLPWIAGNPETMALCEDIERQLLDHALPEVFGLHDGTEAILAGVPVDADFLVREYGNPARCVSYSPFNNLFVLQGMVTSGCFESAIGLLRRCWGGMLALGATTFWESFRPEWQEFLKPCGPLPNGAHGFTSLCHPWSSGPTRWLTDHVLGIRPLAPGYAKFVFDPLPHGPRKVSGSVATPQGIIRAGLEGDSAWVEVPPECRCLAGDKVFEAGRHDLPFLPRLRKPLSLPSPNPVYPAVWEANGTLDAAMSTAIEWIAFSAEPSTGDIQNLHATTRVIIPDERIHGRAWRHHFAEMPAPFTGALRTKYPHVVQQTFSVDILRPEGETFRLGIYCRDVACAKVRQTIEVFDLKTKTLIAPTRLVEDFADGVVLWLTCHRGVRIRACDFPGYEASLNGLFFAPPLLSIASDPFHPALPSNTGFTRNDS